MSSPYIGEIRMFAGNFAPVGWAFCEGQLIPIAENDALFNLIGTTYGGDGQQYFALPNFSSRIPIHSGTSSEGITYTLGEMGGTETETLTVNQIPAHTHPLTATSGPADDYTPSGKYLASPTADVYIPGAPNTNMNAAAITAGGGSQPHTNLQPYLCVNFIISLFGVFPTQN